MTAAFAQDSPVKQVRVAGTDLAYVEQGQGQPVVLVLGGVGDHRVWTGQVAALSSRYRAIAYSFRYHHPNAPAAADADYTVPLHAADLAGLIRALGLGPAHLVGYSYGGNVAAFVARDHPELVRSLVLAEPPLYSVMAQHPDARALLAERAAAMGRVQEDLKAARPDEAIRKFLDFTFAPAGFDSLATADRAVVLANAGILSLLMKAAPAPFTCEHAGRITAPTLLVAGERTSRLFTLTLDELEKCLPRTERATIPRASHAFPFDHPAAFTEVILRFLARP